MQKIDQHDKKIITLLDQDATMSATALAKSLRRSKTFVLYRIRRLEQEGILTGYHAIVDMAKLGYFTFRIYVKFQQTTTQQADTFAQYVRKYLPHVWTITTMHGMWDCALFIGVRNSAQFHETWDHILARYKSKIKEYRLAFYSPVHNFNYTFLLPSTPVRTRTYGSGTAERVDPLDLKLIEAYATNVRSGAVAIGRRLRISPQTVRSRIRALEEKNVIVGYRLGVNLEALGFVGYRVDLELRSTRRNKELLEYCKHHPNIYQVNESIGGSDFEMEFVVKNARQLLGFIDEIKVKFHDVINDANYFGFSTFPVIAYIPD